MFLLYNNEIQIHYCKRENCIMIRVVPLEKKDTNCIVEWNSGKGADFLTQWAGRGYQYPLTGEQIAERLTTDAATDYKIYGIILDGGMIGTVELMKIDDNVKRATIGHFLLDPAKTNHGYGTEALLLLVKKVFQETPLITLELTVFDFNKAAMRCYQKVGFKKIGEVVRPNGWIAVNMEITRHGFTIDPILQIEPRKLEKMSEFFTARIDGYEEHMLKDGGQDVYIKLAELIPDNTKKILDLGCGTGLELDEIFKRLPDVSVVGIDLTQIMLDKLKQKHPDKDIRLICGSYFDIDFGENTLDIAISCQTMHHFSRDEKVGLYQKIREALKPNGVYIEVDYMVTEQSIEDKLHAENAMLRRVLDIPQDEFYHYDIPFTVDNQVRMFKQAGFTSAEMVYRMENSTIIIAKK
jgi:tRNA (cmo5U34)-methyltransferase